MGGSAGFSSFDTYLPRLLKNILWKLRKKYEIRAFAVSRPKRLRQFFIDEENLPICKTKHSIIRIQPQYSFRWGTQAPFTNIT